MCLHAPAHSESFEGPRGRGGHAHARGRGHHHGGPPGFGHAAFFADPRGHGGRGGGRGRGGSGRGGRGRGGHGHMHGHGHECSSDGHECSSGSSEDDEFVESFRGMAHGEHRRRGHGHPEHEGKPADEVEGYDVESGVEQAKHHEAARAEHDRRWGRGAHHAHGFGEFHHGRHGHGHHEHAERPFPRVDILASEAQYVLEIELPGVRKDALAALTVGNDARSVTVQGALPARGEGEGTAQRVHAERRGAREGAFKRTVRLPGAVDKEGVRARLADGVLTVTLEKVKVEEAPVQAVQIE